MKKLCYVATIIFALGLPVFFSSVSINAIGADVAEEEEFVLPEQGSGTY